MSAVDVLLGADVDAARGVVQEQDVGIDAAASAPAAPSADCRRSACSPARRAMAHFSASCRATGVEQAPLLRPRRMKPEPLHPRQHGERAVFEHAHVAS